MTTDNKRDPNDVLAQWDERPFPYAVSDLRYSNDLASALRDALAERRIGESYLQHLRAKLDKAEAVVRAATECNRIAQYRDDWGRFYAVDAIKFLTLHDAIAAYDKEERDGHE